MKIKFSKQAQATLEFTFCFIAVLLIFYGCVMAIRWAGVSMVERKKAQEELLITPVVDNWDSRVGATPTTQLAPNFYSSKSMNLILPDQ